MSEINGYNLTREWYNFRFENPNKAKHVHSDLYFYIIDRWNRFGQKDKFSLPTALTMESLGIRSYNTYKNAIHDLIEFGFVEVVEWSKNQYCSTVIALSKNDKAMYKALDKANDKAMDKALQSYINNKTIEQENKEQPEDGTFEIAWELYTKVGSKKNANQKWNRLKQKERQEIIVHIPKYIERHKQAGKMEFLPHFVTYLNGERWKDELPYSTAIEAPQITDKAAKWKAKLAELKSRQTVIEVTTDPTKPTYKILEYHNGKGMSYIAGVERMLEGWLQQHWELIPLVKEVAL